MAVLIGAYESAIDAKRRLAISAGLREQINAKTDGHDFILVVGPDRHLWLYPDRFYRKVLATIKPSPLPDRRTQKIRLLFGMARPLKSDAQGRVVLPEDSVQWATVSEQVTLVGMFDHIEIWPRQEWASHVQDGLKDYGEMLFQAAEQVRAEGGGTVQP